MTNTARPDFHSLITAAHALAETAGAVILPHFRNKMDIEDKGTSDSAGDFDPVTVADRGAEAAIRKVLGETFPGHGIIGEEYGDERTDAELCWILDPIDGTRAFIMGQPLWGTLIGLTEAGTPLLGMMNQPYTGERFWSGETESFFSRGSETQKISTRSCPALDQAILASTAPEIFDDWELSRFEALTNSVRLRRFGGDCYNYCLLAMGQIDLVVEAGLKPFDIMPLVPIIERAGGRVTTWDGQPPSKGGRILAAGDPDLHEKAMAVLSA